MEDVGVEIVHSESTGRKQNQKGQIKRQIRDRSPQKKGQIEFKDNKASQPQKDRSGNKKGQIKDRSKDTTIYTNNRTKTNNTKTAKKELVPPPDPDTFKPSEKFLKWYEKNKFPKAAMKVHIENCFLHFIDKGTERPGWENTLRKWVRNDLTGVNEKYGSSSQPELTEFTGY